MATKSEGYLFSYGLYKELWNHMIINNEGVVIASDDDLKKYGSFIEERSLATTAAEYKNRAKLVNAVQTLLKEDFEKPRQNEALASLLERLGLQLADDGYIVLKPEIPPQKFLGISEPSLSIKERQLIEDEKKAKVLKRDLKTLDEWLGKISISKVQIKKLAHTSDADVMEAEKNARIRARRRLNEIEIQRRNKIDKFNADNDYKWKKILGIREAPIKYKQKKVTTGALFPAAKITADEKSFQNESHKFETVDEAKIHGLDAGKLSQEKEVGKPVLKDFESSKIRTRDDLLKPKKTFPELKAKDVKSFQKITKKKINTKDQKSYLQKCLEDTKCMDIDLPKKYENKFPRSELTISDRLQKSFTEKEKKDTDHLKIVNSKLHQNQKKKMHHIVEKYLLAQKLADREKADLILKLKKDLIKRERPPEDSVIKSHKVSLDTKDISKLSEKIPDGKSTSSPRGKIIKQSQDSILKLEDTSQEDKNGLKAGKELSDTDQLEDADKKLTPAISDGIKIFSKERSVDKQKYSSENIKGKKRDYGRRIPRQLISQVEFSKTPKETPSAKEKSDSAILRDVKFQHHKTLRDISDSALLFREQTSTIDDQKYPDFLHPQRNGRHHESKQESLPDPETINSAKEIPLSDNLLLKDIDKKLLKISDSVPLLRKEQLIRKQRYSADDVQEMKRDDIASKIKESKDVSLDVGKALLEKYLEKPSVDASSTKQEAKQESTSIGEKLKVSASDAKVTDTVEESLDFSRALEKILQKEKEYLLSDVLVKDRKSSTEQMERKEQDDTETADKMSKTFVGKKKLFKEPERATSAKKIPVYDRLLGKDLDKTLLKISDSLPLLRKERHIDKQTYSSDDIQKKKTDDIAARIKESKEISLDAGKELSQKSVDKPSAVASITKVEAKHKPTVNGEKLKKIPESGTKVADTVEESSDYKREDGQILPKVQKYLSLDGFLKEKECTTDRMERKEEGGEKISEKTSEEFLSKEKVFEDPEREIKAKQLLLSEHLLVKDLDKTLLKISDSLPLPRKERHIDKQTYSSDDVQKKKTDDIAARIKESKEISLDVGKEHSRKSVDKPSAVASIAKVKAKHKPTFNGEKLNKIPDSDTKVTDTVEESSDYEREVGQILPKEQKYLSLDGFLKERECTTDRMERKEQDGAKILEKTSEEFLSKEKVFEDPEREISAEQLPHSEYLLSKDLDKTLLKISDSLPLPRKERHVDTQTYSSDGVQKKKTDDIAARIKNGKHVSLDVEKKLSSESLEKPWVDASFSKQEAKHVPTFNEEKLKKVSASVTKAADSAEKNLDFSRESGKILSKDQEYLSRDGLLKDKKSSTDQMKKEQEDGEITEIISKEFVSKEKLLKEPESETSAKEISVSDQFMAEDLNKRLLKKSDSVPLLRKEQLIRKQRYSADDVREMKRDDIASKIKESKDVSLDVGKELSRKTLEKPSVDVSFTKQDAKEVLTSNGDKMKKVSDSDTQRTVTADENSYFSTDVAQIPPKKKIEQHLSQDRLLKDKNYCTDETETQAQKHKGTKIAEEISAEFVSKGKAFKEPQKTPSAEQEPASEHVSDLDLDKRLLKVSHSVPLFRKEKLIDKKNYSCDDVQEIKRDAIAAKTKESKDVSLDVAKELSRKTLEKPSADVSFTKQEAKEEPVFNGEKFKTVCASGTRGAVTVESSDFSKGADKILPKEKIKQHFSHDMLLNCKKYSTDEREKQAQKHIEIAEGISTEIVSKEKAFKEPQKASSAKQEPVSEHFLDLELDKGLLKIAHSVPSLRKVGHIDKRSYSSDDVQKIERDYIGPEIAEIKDFISDILKEPSRKCLVKPSVDVSFTKQEAKQEPTFNREKLKKVSASDTKIADTVQESLDFRKEFPKILPKEQEYLSSDGLLNDKKYSADEMERKEPEDAKISEKSSKEFTSKDKLFKEPERALSAKEISVCDHLLVKDLDKSLLKKSDSVPLFRKEQLSRKQRYSSDDIQEMKRDDVAAKIKESKDISLVVGKEISREPLGKQSLDVSFTKQGVREVANLKKVSASDTKVAETAEECSDFSREVEELSPKGQEYLSRDGLLKDKEDTTYEIERKELEDTKLSQKTSKEFMSKEKVFKEPKTETSVKQIPAFDHLLGKDIDKRLLLKLSYSVPLCRKERIKGKQRYSSDDVQEIKRDDISAEVEEIKDASLDVGKELSRKSLEKPSVEVSFAKQEAKQKPVSNGEKPKTVPVYDKKVADTVKESSDFSREVVQVLPKEREHLSRDGLLKDEKCITDPIERKEPKDTKVSEKISKEFGSREKVFKEPEKVISAKETPVSDELLGKDFGKILLKISDSVPLCKKESIKYKQTFSSDDVPAMKGDDIAAEIEENKQVSLDTGKELSEKSLDKLSAVASLTKLEAKHKRPFNGEKLKKVSASDTKVAGMVEDFSREAEKILPEEQEYLSRDGLSKDKMYITDEMERKEQKDAKLSEKSSKVLVSKEKELETSVKQLPVYDHLLSKDIDKRVLLKLSDSVPLRRKDIIKGKERYSSDDVQEIKRDDISAKIEDASLDVGKELSRKSLENPSVEASYSKQEAKQKPVSNGEKPEKVSASDTKVADTVEDFSREAEKILPKEQEYLSRDGLLKDKMYATDEMERNEQKDTKLSEKSSKVLVSKEKELETETSVKQLPVFDRLLSKDIDKKALLKLSDSVPLRRKERIKDKERYSSDDVQEIKRDDISAEIQEIKDASLDVGKELSRKSLEKPSVEASFSKQEAKQKPVSNGEKHKKASSSDTKVADTVEETLDYSRECEKVLPKEQEDLSRYGLLKKEKYTTDRMERKDPEDTEIMTDKTPKMFASKEKLFKEPQRATSAKQEPVSDHTLDLDVDNRILKVSDSVPLLRKEKFTDKQRHSFADVQEIKREYIAPKIKEIRKVSWDVGKKLARKSLEKHSAAFTKLEAEPKVSFDGEKLKKVSASDRNVDGAVKENLDFSKKVGQKLKKEKKYISRDKLLKDIKCSIDDMEKEIQEVKGTQTAKKLSKEFASKEKIFKEPERTPTSKEILRPDHLIGIDFQDLKSSGKLSSSVPILCQGISTGKQTYSSDDVKIKGTKSIGGVSKVSLDDIRSKRKTSEYAEIGRLKDRKEFLEDKDKPSQIYKSDVSLVDTSDMIAQDVVAKDLDIVKDENEAKFSQDKDKGIIHELEKIQYGDHLNGNEKYLEAEDRQIKTTESDKRRISIPVLLVRSSDAINKDTGKYDEISRFSDEKRLSVLEGVDGESNLPENFKQKNSLDYIRSKGALPKKRLDQRKIPSKEELTAKESTREIRTLEDIMQNAERRFSEIARRKSVSGCPPEKTPGEASVTHEATYSSKPTVPGQKHKEEIAKDALHVKSDLKDSPSGISLLKRKDSDTTAKEKFEKDKLTKLLKTNQNTEKVTSNLIEMSKEVKANKGLLLNKALYNKLSGKKKRRKGK